VGQEAAAQIPVHAVLQWLAGLIQALQLRWAHRPEPHPLPQPCVAHRPRRDGPASAPLPPPPPTTVSVDTMELVPVESAPASALVASVAVVPAVAAREDGDDSGVLDLRLFLMGMDGRCVLMELDSRVLCSSSAFFASMAPRDCTVADGKRIDVDRVENLEAFQAAVELMYEPDPVRWLARSCVSRAIDVLEVKQEPTHLS
jgi:hypothetical protein